MQSTVVVRIDQALHGYDRGHRELAASIALDDRSRATMLVLSDLLATTDLQEGVTYLTSYPLKSASRHVLAGTWTAGHGYRPGSVWTHSLILDYQALALVTDLVALRSILTEPMGRDRSEYARHLTFDTAERSDAVVERGARALHALRQIYSDKLERDIVLARADVASNETLALALWRQMWPGLRRDFAFMTGGGDRMFDLEAGCVLRFSNSPADEIKHLDDGDLDRGHRALLNDLPEPGPTPLRTFLSRYAIEGAQPRRLAAPLALLRDSMEDAPLDLRLSQVRTLTRKGALPRLVRDMVAAEIGRAASSDDIILLVREFRHEAVDVDLTGAIERIEAMSDLDLSRLIAATQPSARDQLGGRLFNEIVRTCRLQPLAASAEGQDRHSMLQLRPELAKIQAFWPKDDKELAELIEQIDGLTIVDGLEIFSTTMGRQTVAALLRASPNVPPSAVIPLLVDGNQQVREAVADWIVRQPQRLASVAHHPEAMTADIADALARAQIASGAHIVDPPGWERLVSTLAADAKRLLGGATLVVTYLSALELDRASGLKLARIVYDPLQETVRRYRLSRVNERYLESCLPPLGRTWSIRNSLTRSAVLKWPPEDSDPGAMTISDNPEHVKDLVDEVAMRHGPAVLEHALKTGGLTVEAEHRIKRLLEPAKNKRRPFSWW